MARLTAVRRARPGEVVLELDGRAWRTVPDDVVARLGLAPGIEVDRPLLRAFRRELRAAEARAAAGRVLARRDLSARRLEDRLTRGRIRRPTAEATVARLEQIGLVDDARLARARAAALATAGWGDAAILAWLDRERVAEAVAAEAVAGLEPEHARARRLVGSVRQQARAARLLFRRGFAEETIEHVIGVVDGRDPVDDWPDRG